MANIRKTFNFRNGVQVDEDNFIVDSLGKVGIGTTVPTQMIDCRGNAKVVGILTSQSLETRNANIAGVTTFSGNTHVGSAITMYPVTGIISATQIHGDGRNLINIPTSQWTDINAGLGHTSIYNSGFVGVSTNDPRFTFQVGGNNDLTTFANGVGINSSGNVVATGVITATTFKGDYQGSLVDATIVDAEGLVVSGVSTISGVSINSGHTSALSVGSTYLNVSGVSTFSGDVTVAVGATLTGFLKVPDNNTLEIGTGVTVTSIPGAYAETAFHHTSHIHYIAELSNKSSKWISRLPNGALVPQFRIWNNAAVESYYSNGGIKLSTSGIGITVYGVAVAGQFTGNVNTGVATVSTKLDLGGVSSQGISTSSPQSELHVFNSGISSVLIESGSNESVVTLGRNTNGQTSGAIRYGNKSTGFPYSNEDALDIINYGVGNVNFYLSGGTTAGTGDFHWNYRANSARLMTLTNDGKLGIGKTLPTTNLDVDGTGTFTGLDVNGNGDISGNLTLGGELTMSGTDGVKANVIATNDDIIVSPGPNIAGAIVNANLNSPGISTIQTLTVNNIIGIKTDIIPDTNLLFVKGPGEPGITGDFRFSVTKVGHIGVGIASALCTADFAGIGNTFRHYMRPPQLTTANRAVMQAEAESGALEGAMIYLSLIHI